MIWKTKRRPIIVSHSHPTWLEEIKEIGTLFRKEKGTKLVFLGIIVYRPRLDLAHDTRLSAIRTSEFAAGSNN
jgi:hypothetical protein